MSKEFTTVRSGLTADPWSVKQTSGAGNLNSMTGLGILLVQIPMASFDAG